MIVSSSRLVICSDNSLKLLYKDGLRSLVFVSLKNCVKTSIENVKSKKVTLENSNSEEILLISINKICNKHLLESNWENRLFTTKFINNN